MSDRRTTPFSGRVALSSVAGAVDAERVTDGWAATMRDDAFLCAAPGGRRDRQLLFGDPVTGIERRGRWTYLRSDKDGYCGWLPEPSVGPPVGTTHRVTARTTWAYPAPDMKTEALLPLHLNARVRVTGTDGRWSEIALPAGHPRERAFMPAAHLSDRPDTDPVAVARRFLGTPYVWGGNTGFGLDCSGLVQAALLACGVDCPGDSDQQAAAVGAPLDDDAPLSPGDLLFWRGHVAMVADADRLIHANAHAMAVTLEDINACITRIAAQGEGPVTARRRPAFHPAGNTPG